MKECKRLKCPKNKGLQGFARVRNRAKALPDDAPGKISVQDENTNVCFMAQPIMN